MKNFKKIILSAILAGSMITGAGVSALTTPVAAAEKVGLNYYISDYETKLESNRAAREWRTKAEREGVVLLKNKDNALPLKKGSRITVFGKNQSDTYAELEKIGFQMNTAVRNFYFDSGRSPATYTAISGNTTVNGKSTGETALSNLTGDSANLQSTYKDYSDMAIVVFKRSGGEGHDNPRTMKWNGKSVADTDASGEANQPVPGARSMDDHYLQLDQNETDLLAHVCDNFAKVTVILATASQMEVGFLDDPNHYAYHENIVGAIWSSGSGYAGAAAVIAGEANPSGRLVDTWARDYKLDPVWMNFGNNLVEGSYLKKGNLYANYATSDSYMSSYRGTYVIYKEGIYVGYRYYETRSFVEGDEAYTSQTGEVHGTTTTAWNDWYQSRVSYPFGFGLSYTTFTQEIVEKNYEAGAILPKDGEITLKVKVTNTGSVAGKDVVQLYYTAPYKTNGIEKSHVVLGAFGKSQLIEPGESDIVTLTMNVRNMASYDWNDANANGFKGYELEAGDYTLRLMKNSHEEIANVTYNVAENATYETDVVTGTKIENKFDKISNYLLEDTKEENGNYYMSRADFEGTFPKTSFRENMPEWVRTGLNEWEVKNGRQTRVSSLDEQDPEYTRVMPKFDAKNGIMLEDLHGLDYDDEMYEKYLDQFSREQLIAISTQGGYWTGIDAPKLGMKKTSNVDGPYGFTPQSFVNNGTSNDYVWLGDVTICASTWNEEIEYERGRIVGNFALWGNGEEYNRVGGWYAPAIDIHRSPFSGRNNEYYSEDPFLTGKMAAAEIRGANSKGLYTYLKHFVFNDQETNRLGVCTWLNEQSMREIYLKPFEIGVKEGKTTGIMSALNRVGYTWTGGSRELLTDILRGEWGFRGTVVTDSYMGDSSNLSNFDQMIRGGGSLALGGASILYNDGTATTYHYLRKAAHDICYTLANSAAINGGAYPVKAKAFKSFETGNVALGILGQEYAYSVATAKLNPEAYPDGNEADIKYTIAEGSKNLPKGLTMTDDGTITGVPQKEVQGHKVTIVATYQDESVTADFYFNIISSDGAIVYTPENKDLGVCYIGNSVIFDVAEAKIYAPDATPDEIAAFPDITYELGSGTILPEGLILSESGSIYGVPTKGCRDYKVTIKAKAIGYRSVEAEYKFSILNTIGFYPNQLQDGKVGYSYGDRIELADCVDTVKYRLKDGEKLPDGLSMTEGGYIVGVPSAAVTDYKFKVEAYSEFTDTKEVEYSITIGLSFGNGMRLPDGKIGEEYLGDIATAIGADDITYSLKNGKLPKGLTVSESGEITGKPTEAGVYTLMFEAKAEGLVSDEVTLTLYVPAAETSSGCNGSVGTACIALPMLSALLFVVAKKKKD